MRERIEIEPITGHAQLAPLLGRWHIAEFGELYPSEVWNFEIAVRELEAMARPGASDRTWLAFDGRSRQPGDLLGSISLLGTDDLDGFEHLSPWLASFFVTPRARGRGVGSALLDAVTTEARVRGDAYLYLFTPDHESYYLERGWRTLATVDRSGRAVSVMTRSTSPRGVRRTVTSRWCSDPDTNGAYAYLRVGARAEHRATLVAPILAGLWFAGEASSVTYPGTMHGAWFSGEQAADAVLAVPGAARVIVVGAGLAGLACARRLREGGRAPIVLEKTDHLGGRACVDTSLGIPLPLGGAWLHGEIGHPLETRVSYRPDDWTDDATFLIGQGAVCDDDRSAARAALEHVEATLARAPAARSAAQVLPVALASLDLSPVVRATVEGWFTDEIENLCGAPLEDIGACGFAEQYMLPGENQLVTSSLVPVFDELADGLDIRYGHRVASLTLEGAGWTTDTAVVADAVVVTAPIAALRTGRIRFAPPLPAPVIDAFEHLGAGPIAKVFATYGERWWPSASAIRIVGGSAFTVAADMTDLTGVPTLCWFAVGESARRVETLSEDERCRLVDRVATESGLADWDLA